MPVNGNRKRGRTGMGMLADNRPFQVVYGEGPCPARVMLIGERPGEQEAKSGRPFVGLAGQYLNTFLQIAGINREEIYITNLVKDYLDYDKPRPEDIEQWWTTVVDEIASVRPSIVGLLGTYAVEAVLGRERAGLERVHGVPVQARIGDGWECTVLPMYHPAAGIYAMDAMTYVYDDVMALKMVMDGRLHARGDEHVGKEDYRAIDGGGATVRRDVAIDTESAGKRAWCLTYSCDPGKSFLQYPGQVSRFESDIVYVHNSMHDLDVLRKLGAGLGEGQFRDTMVWAYLLQLEPQGLKDLAWRHCGMQMDSYDDILGRARYYKALEYLEGVNACEWSEARPYVAVEGGKARIKKPNSINQRVSRILHDVDVDKRGKKGDPVDPRKRWYNIEDDIKAEVVAELGEMPEATLDDIPRDKAERYACRDADATRRIAPVLEAKINEMGLALSSEIDHAVLPTFDRMQYVGIQLASRQFWDSLEEKCQREMDVQVHKIYKETGWEINPDSPKQVRELLFNPEAEGGLGLPVTKWTKGGKGSDGKPKEPEASTIDKALEAIVRLHPVVDNVLVYREASKIKNSYVTPLRRAATTTDGRVHCTFRLTHVVTGRPSATHPNLLAIPARSEMGREIRGGFVAPDGRVIGDWDEDQIEMRYMADESGDERLCNLFIAGTRDVHTSTASEMFGIAYENVRKEERYAAKRVGFGIITGITEHGLLDQMALARAKRSDGRDWTLDDCQQMIATYFQISPGVKGFMTRAGQEADAYGYVRDRWGRRRYLPGIWSPIPAVRAEAARQASSFKIQAGAQGYMKQGMKSVWDYVIKAWAWNKGWDEQWPVEPLLQIYDSMMFEIDEQVAPVVGEDIVMCLTKTVSSRRGVPFTAKGGYGKTWLTT